MPCWRTTIRGRMLYAPTRNLNLELETVVGHGPPGPKAVVRLLVEQGINQGRLEVVDQVLAPTFPSILPDRNGPANVKQLLATYRAAVPDAHWAIEEQISDGDTVVTCFMASGTQCGPLWGVPATGRRTAVSGILVSRCRGGQIVSQRVQLDLLGLLQQLGMMPDLTLDEVVTVAQVARAGVLLAREPALDSLHATISDADSRDCDVDSPTERPRV